MMQIPPESIRGHFVSIALPIMLSFAVKEASSWWRDRQKQKRGESEIVFMLRNFRLHDHPEPSGVLHAENIRFPRANGQ